MPEDAPACLGCGACCFSKLANYVRVDGADHSRIGVQVDELTHFDGNRCYMNMSEGHCAALVIDLAMRRFVCSIYETRPSTCRDLERASPACQGEIHEKSERPLLLLSSLLGGRWPALLS
ncbi:MAG: YkgJ family cysteine cluster protein [Pseudomonadota bacterium]